MAFRYHGNWCGPGWSDGLWQQSVIGSSPAIDDFDETCRQHDFALSGGRSNLKADWDFVSSNIGKGPKRALAAVAVASRAVLTYASTVNKLDQNETTMSKQALRGSKNQPRTMSARNTPIKTSVAAPVAVGSVIRSRKTVHRQVRNGAVLEGCDFLSPVEAQGTTTFGLGKSALLSPAYFVATFLGNMSRSFEKYRWRKLRIHYVPKVSTNTNGQVVLCSQHSVSEPALAGESGTFLSRAMSQGNAAMGPLWMENYIDIDVGNDWMMVDPATTSDPDDAIAEELLVYTQATVAQQVGYLYAEYVIEFKELTYTPHSLSIPAPTGPGVRCILRDTLAVNNLNDDWSLLDLTGALGLVSAGIGSIYRCVFDLQGSVAYNAIGFPVAFRTSTATYSSAVGTFNPSTTTINMIGGTVLYLLQTGSNTLVAFLTLESAASGGGVGQVFFNSSSTSTGVYNFDIALIRHSPTYLAATQ